MATAKDLALEVLNENADGEVIATAKYLEESGKATWVFDPEVPNVVGLIKPGTNRAFMVVYVKDGDFETSDEFWE